MITPFYDKDGITIYCGDALVVMKSIENSKLAILDPPQVGVVKESWDKLDIITDNFILDIYNSLTIDSSLYVWCSFGEKSKNMLNWFPLFSKSFYFKDLIVWKKQRGMGNKKGWLYTREECLWFVKK